MPAVLGVSRLSRPRPDRFGRVTSATPRLRLSLVTAAQAEWADDVLPGYQQTTLPLGADPDGEGDLFATLVRRGRLRHRPRAVLAVHGYTDYFFNTELADHFTARGSRFYALDLHKCGRSWRDGQTPHFTTDLARYDRELERATAIITAENPGSRVLVYGHSAGGLVVSLWLDRVRRRGATAALGIGRTGAQQPVAGSARPGDPADPADVHGDRGALAGAQDLGGARHRQGRLRADAAPRVPRRVRLQPAVEAAGRLPGDVRLDPRHPARAGHAAPRAGRRACRI